MSSFYLDRPLNFAHRGASAEAPANTLAAFMLASELGADGIELDVHLSRDGEIVVIHDFTVESTTDGEGKVANKTLAELRELDAGSWFDPAFAGQQIPTLQEVVDAVGDRLLLNIEIKTKSLRDSTLSAEVVRLIERNHLFNRVVVSSFNPRSLRWVRQLNSSIPIGFLYSPDQPWWLRGEWMQALVQPDALHPHYSQLDDEMMMRARERGYRIHTWTVDDPGEMWKLVRQRVDLIITNRPDILSKVLDTGRVHARS
jgi:glycerophosphoryl diester phosphodiesterase